MDMESMLVSDVHLSAEQAEVLCGISLFNENKTRAHIEMIYEVVQGHNMEYFREQVQRLKKVGFIVSDDEPQDIYPHYEITHKGKKHLHLIQQLEQSDSLHKEYVQRLYNVRTKFL